MSKTVMRRDAMRRDAMRLGAHLSIAGGVWKAVERAAQAGCETLQIFVTNPRGWKTSTLTQDDVARFAHARAEFDVRPIVAHMPYLPNIGSTDAEIYAKSVASLEENLDLCDALKLDALVMHMGRSKDAPPQLAVEQMTRAIDQTYCHRNRHAVLCLENTAGQGSEMGHDLATLGEIMNRCAAPQQLGLCLDTCHAFAAGYDLRTKADVNALVKQIDRHVGLERLRVLHLNDSKRELGARRDRHEHIGQGHVGAEAFGHLINHPKLRHLPGILETPQDTPDAVERNLSVLRALQA